MTTSVSARERMLNRPASGLALFERVAPAIARMNRDRVGEPSGELCGAYWAEPVAVAVAYERLAVHFERAGLRGLAAFYYQRAGELS